MSSVKSRLRLPIVVIVGFAFATLLALAAFTSAEAAEQKYAAAKEPTDAAATEGTNPEETVTIEQHNWSTYHWGRTNTPFTLTLGDNVTADWDSYLNNAAGLPTPFSGNDWSDSTVLNAPVDTGNVSRRALKRKKCPYTLGRVEVCNAAYGDNGWSGLAQIWLDSSGHIVAGVAKMNDTKISSTDTWKRRHVMCQEVGHTFGLGHTSENGTSQLTCMDYSGSQDSQWPNQHDYDELSAIYDPGFKWPDGYSDNTAPLAGHTDTTSTVGTSSASKLPAAANRDNYDTRAKWGQLKHRDEAGKHAVFEREFSDGTKLVTFVEVEDQEILEDQEDQPQEKKQAKAQEQPQEEGKKQDQ
ncbi:MAG: hypothetical protein LC781_22025 [Actinobacteria bacterium]|nr:hypothetical protein [Actinomycetota bacterium]